jgi:BolA protein
MDEDAVQRIRDRLAVLDPDALEIEDESELHVGHAGAGAGGHFRLRVVSRHFTGLDRVGRHRLVYNCLFDLMQRDIHALAMTLLAPEEPGARLEPPSEG